MSYIINIKTNDLDVLLNVIEQLARGYKKGEIELTNKTS